MGVRRLGLWIGRVLIAVGLLWAGTFLAIWIYAISPAEPSAIPEPADAIICLGAGMSRTQGWRAPDSASHRRATTCARLHASGVAPIIIFTGYGHEISSAAAAMARIAGAEGVPDADMLVEEEALSTIQNAAFVVPLLPAGAERIVVVSDRFHLPRSAVIFRLLTALEVDVYPADPHIDGPDPGGRTRLHWITREASAIWLNVARGTTYVVAGWLGVDAAARIGWFN